MRRELIDPEIIAAFKYLGTVSFNLTLHIIGGFFLGRYLDGRLNTEPILSALGTIVGTFTGFYGIYRLVMRDFSDGSRSSDGTDESAQKDKKGK